MICFYDLPIGHWRAMRRMLLNWKKRLNPRLGDTPLKDLKDSSEKLDRKDKEIGLADKIFVASGFTAETLEHIPT